jgi:hypothetical protein
MARRIRAPVADLSEYGKLYKGKNVTRKEILDSEDDEDDDDDDDEEGDEEDEEEEESGDEESDASNLEDDDDEEMEEEDSASSKSKPKNGQVKEANKSGISLINLNQSEEKAKGKAVKNQLSN